VVSKLNELNTDVNDNSALNKKDEDELEEEEIVHLEQHELPLGWVKCCGKILKFFNKKI
jgi:hypothetical protein